MAGKVPEVGALGAAEKKVKMLEQQRMEVSGWRGSQERPFFPPGTSRIKDSPGL